MGVGAGVCYSDDNHRWKKASTPHLPLLVEAGPVRTIHHYHQHHPTRPRRRVEDRMNTGEAFLTDDMNNQNRVRIGGARKGPRTAIAS